MPRASVAAVTMRDRSVLTFHFDGGCRPNPGRMEAAVVSRGRIHVRDDLGWGDNNEAEWLALLYALDLARAAGATDALFLGDSALVIDQASRGRCRSAHLRPHLAAFQAAAATLPRVRLRRVPRSRNLAGIALARLGPAAGSGRNGRPTPEGGERASALPAVGGRRDGWAARP